MNLRKLGLLFILFFVSNLSFADASQKDLAKFRDEYIKTHTLNAIYAVYSGETPLIQGASGYYSKKIKEDPSSKDILLGFEQRMPIASGTKQMTAAAILRLQDQKRLHVEDVISKYIPADSPYWGGNMPDWANKIKIHNLLTHTSGIAEYIFALNLDLTKPHKEINSQIMQFAAKSPLLFNPGERFEYCNTGYVIIGIIIETVSGKELASFLQDEFFTPLGMKNTHLPNIKEALDYQTGKLYDIYPNRYFLIPGNIVPLYSPVKTSVNLPPFADGGVVSTARDMNKWMYALHNGKVLSEEALKLMTSPHIRAKDKILTESYYGYGIYILKQNDKTIYSHGGNAIAIRGEYSYIKELNTSVIILSNTMVHVPEALEGKIDMTQEHNQVDIMFFNKGLISLLCN